MDIDIQNQLIKAKKLSLPEYKYPFPMTHDTALRIFHHLMSHLIGQAKQNTCTGVISKFEDWFDSRLFDNPDKITLMLRSSNSLFSNKIIINKTSNLIYFSCTFENQLTGLQAVTPYIGSYSDIAKISTNIASQAPPQADYDIGTPPYDHLVAQDILSVIQGKMPTFYTSQQHLQFFSEIATLLAFESSKLRDPSYKQFGTNLLLLHMIAQQQTYGKTNKLYLFCNSFDSAVKINGELKYKRTEDKEKQRRTKDTQSDIEPPENYKIITEAERNKLTSNSSLEGDIIGGKSPASTKSPNKKTEGIFSFNQLLDDTTKKFTGNDYYIHDDQISKNRVLMKQAKLLFYWLTQNSSLNMSVDQQQRIKPLLIEQDKLKVLLIECEKNDEYQKYQNIQYQIREIHKFNKNNPSNTIPIDPRLMQEFKNLQNCNGVKNYRKHRRLIGEQQIEISKIIEESKPFNNFFEQLCQGTLSYLPKFLHKNVRQNFDTELKSEKTDDIRHEDEDNSPPTKRKKLTESEQRLHSSSDNIDVTTEIKTPSGGKRKFEIPVKTKHIENEDDVVMTVEFQHPYPPHFSNLHPADTSKWNNPIFVDPKQNLTNTQHHNIESQVIHFSHPNQLETGLNSHPIHVGGFTNNPLSHAFSIKHEYHIPQSNIPHLGNTPPLSTIPLNNTQPIMQPANEVLNKITGLNNQLKNCFQLPLSKDSPIGKLKLDKRDESQSCITELESILTQNKDRLDINSIKEYTSAVNLLKHAKLKVNEAATPNIISQRGFSR